MKLRSFFSILATVVAVLLVVSAVGFYWLFSQNPLTLLNGGELDSPQAAMFVPRQAPLMVSLLVNPDRLEALREVVAGPEQRKQARAEFAQLRQSVLATSDLNYEQDVKPWIGNELTLAITTLDSDRDPANGRQPGYLLAVASKDPERSREFLQLFWQKRALAGTDLVFEQYKGVKLIYGNQPTVLSNQRSEGGNKNMPKTLPLASAVVGDRFVLFANSPKVLRDAINNVQAPDLSLSSASFYQQALDSLTQPRVGLTFVNLPGLASWVTEKNILSSSQTLSATAKPTNSSGTPQKPSTPQTLAIALTLDRQGLLAETALAVPNPPVANVMAMLAQPVGALKYLPATTPVSASGINLARIWTGFSNQLSGYEALSQLTSQSLADLQKRWKLDLPKDVFDWVKDEYALGLLPQEVKSGERGERNQKRKGSQKSEPKNLNPANEWIFVAQRSNPDAAKAIAHLDDLAKQQGLSVGAIQLGDQTVSAWTKLSTGFGKNNADSFGLQAQVQGVHATVGNYEIFTTSLAAMDRTLKTMAGSLTDATTFQQAIAPMLQPNNGYLYLDWKTASPLLEQRFPILKVVELAGKPLFSHLRSLTFSSYGSQAGIQRGGIFVRLS